MATIGKVAKAVFDPFGLASGGKRPHQGGFQEFDPFGRAGTQARESLEFLTRGGLESGPLAEALQGIQFGPQERARATEAFTSGQELGLRQILEQAQADVQRAGLGDTTIPAQLGMQARERALSQRLAFEVQLDDLARNLASQRFGALLQGGGFLAGIGGGRQQFATPGQERSVSGLQQFGQLALSLGGQALGAYAGGRGLGAGLNRGAGG